MTGSALDFALLGLGGGAVYGLVALGVVLVYRGSGVVNFAAGAFGMIGAFIFYDERSAGTNAILCWVYALIFAVAAGAIMQLVIMRSLRRAPTLTRVIATLGVFTILYAWANQAYGDSPRVVSTLLPQRGITLLPGNIVGEDRLILLGIGVVLTLILTIGYRKLKFGLATSAVAESRAMISAHGISPDVVATVNWVLGSALSVVGAILVVDVIGLSVEGLALLVIPALAAALIGGFRSFPLTLVGAIILGILESEVNWLQAFLSIHLHRTIILNGWSESVPLLAIVVVLVVRGRALPVRGDEASQPPLVGTGRVRPWTVLLMIAGSVVVAVGVSPNLLQALTTSAAISVVLLSLVVVTGFAGQLSLAQFAFAGFGSWICAVLVAQHGWPFELAALAGVVGTVPLGLLVGLPSLRARGVNLAVITLALAEVIEVQIFDSPNFTGGVSGLNIGTPRIFGVVIDPIQHPLSYAFFALGCLIVVSLVVATVRRGRVGRRLVAVRSNERAAASLGISVIGTKLYAFALSGAIAAVGGIVLLFQQQNAVFIPTFAALQSILGLVPAVVGGVGFVLGATLGGAQSPAGLLPTALGSVIHPLQTSTTVQLILGAGLLVVLWKRPNGLAAPSTRIAKRTQPHWITGWTRVFRSPPESLGIDELSQGDVDRVAPKTLEANEIRVRYGGVLALDGVSLTVNPGAVVGLIGPNGAGKTTFIDAITGFTTARGHIALGGLAIRGWSVRRRSQAGLARSFQSLELFETMTVLENIRTAIEPRDKGSYLTGLLRARRVPLTPPAVAAIRQFGLEGDLLRRPDELSQGRRRLVAIARAVASAPSVLLLDEPAAGLDEMETRELGRLIRDLADTWGMGVLLVEHDVSLVFDTCDQVHVLDCGAPLASGPPSSVAKDQGVIDAYLGQVSEEGEARRRERRIEDGHQLKPPRQRRSTPPLVSVEDLTSGYGGIEVLREINFEVEPGEVVAVLGPNGAGKTTLLRCLAGELPVIRGSAAVLGVPSGSPLHRRARAGLAYVPDDRGIVKSLTAEGNLRLGRGTVLDAVGQFPELEKLLKRKAGLLSGGEQQMLALGRALAATPQLLLIDELSQGLAPLVVDRLLSSVRSAADQGVGVLLVEQHAAEALHIADRAIVLRRGRVELEGTSTELIGHFDEIENAYLSFSGASSRPEGESAKSP